MYHDASWLETAGRLLLVSLFLVTGLCNLTRARIKDHTDRMIAFHVPFPTAVHWAGIALQFTGCALVIADWHAEIGVYCLILFIVAATAIFHRFWIMQDPMRRNLSQLMLINNTGILGGLLLLLENVR